MRLKETFVVFTGMLVAGLVIYYLDRFSGEKHFFGELRPKVLLTPNEVDFYKRLCAAVQGQWVIFAQVSMGALMDTKLPPEDPAYWRARNQFASKICDFVLCHPKTLAPVLIVELDDVTHDFAKDARRDQLTARAGHRTIRFWSRNKPSVEELRLRISRELALVPQ